MHRQRHQKGSLQVRQHGKRKMWVLLYRDGSTRKYATLGLYSKMNKSQAEEKRDELLNEVNARNAVAPDPDITFGDFARRRRPSLPAVEVEAVYRRNHGKPHPASLVTRIRRHAPYRSWLEGIAGCSSTPRR